MNAPFSRPNSSLSISVAGIAAQFTRTIARRAAGAQLVDLRREQLLAGAGFAEQQHRRVGARHVLHLLEDLPDRGALADDVAGAVPFLGLGPKVDVLGVELIAKTRDLFRSPDEAPSSFSRRARTLANAPAKTRKRCTTSGGQVRSCRNVTKPTAPTTRPPTDRGTVTPDRTPGRAVALPVDRVRDVIEGLESTPACQPESFRTPTVIVC